MDSKIVKNRKVGTVNKLSSDNSVTVNVESRKQHRLYKKIIRRSKKYLVHVDSDIELKVGEKVVIESCKPISKRKHWRVLVNSENSRVVK